MKKNYKLALIIIAAVILLGAFFLFTRGNSDSSQSSNPLTGKSSPKVVVQKIDIKKNLDIPTGLEKTGGKPVTVTFKSATLTNRINVSGKPVYAKKGTNFLMLNLLVENPNPRRMGIRTRDVLRLIDQFNKKFAPSLYNKNIAIEGDAAKNDVLGFVVPSNMKTFHLQYGTLAGEKLDMELKFK